jgi:hypothetical protein
MRGKTRGEHTQKMPNVFTKGILVSLAFGNVKLNGVLKFARPVKIRGFDTFSRCKSRGGGYRVGYGSTLKLSSGRRLYRVYVYYDKRYCVNQ